MKRMIIFAVTTLLLAPPPVLCAVDVLKPNFLIINIDDLGYETIGANGGTSYRTPHLDKLAATGVRFTHCFVQPLCTPTRVQLMTYTNGEYGPDLVNDYALDFITRKKNGTGRGMRSMMGDRLVIGGKGTTTDAGMHVPLIASWPDKITAGRVCSDLVDSTDFLPTILDAAGMVTLSGVKLDGRTFLPQILGAEGQPRDWIYSWYSPRQSADMTIRESAFNRRYKLYRSGEFFDLGKDLEERQPLKVASLEGEAAAAAKLLQETLDQFKDARSFEFDRAFEQANKGKANGRGKRQCEPRERI